MRLKLFERRLSRPEQNIGDDGLPSSSFRLTGVPRLFPEASRGLFYSDHPIDALQEMFEASQTKQEKEMKHDWVL